MIKAETHSKELLEAVLQGIGAGVVVIDEGGRCLLSNTAAEQLLGKRNVQRIDALQTETSGFFCTDKVTPLKMDVSPFAKAMRGEFTDREEVYVRNHRYPFGGWYSFTVRPLRVNDNAATGGVIIIEDITERRKLSDEVERSNRDLQQFAYVAAHDLQEPLRTVTGFGELLAKSMTETQNDKALDQLRRIIAASKRMQTLISALLSYARIETRAKPPQVCDTNSIVGDVLADLADAIATADAKVEVSQLPNVVADPSQLSQVFHNLIGNSLKYRTEHPIIQINAITEGHFHHFIVKDNGIGIASKFAERVFVIFQRLHNKSKYEGVGIGLSLCKKIIENHGGKIFIQPCEEQGTEIHFTLPVIAKEVESDKEY